MADNRFTWWGHGPLIAPSILDSDLADLRATLAMLEAAGVRVVHLDVMDGRFVPNISIGIPVVASIRHHTSLTLDVHLMIEQPERYIQEFVDAGADILTVHPEATPHVHRALQSIRAAGARAGIALNPGTPVGHAIDLLPMADLVLIMSVNPGFGGQKFIETSLGRLRTLRDVIDASGHRTLLEVDGGINPETIGVAREAGADLFVAGSAIFRAGLEPPDAVRRLQAMIDGNS
jgi:ribulose-phosphate 3-epimerase